MCVIGGSMMSDGNSEEFFDEKQSEEDEGRG